MVMNGDSYWASHEVTANIIALLHDDPKAVQTRDLLKPLFKFCKDTSRFYDFEAGFAFTASVEEWAQRQPHIQVKYLYNTLVVMAQRIGSAAYAQRAYEAMQARGHRPDVFTVTAVIDVTGRASPAAAVRLFAAMLRERNPLPNIVTFVTVLRLLGACEDAREGLDGMLWVLGQAAALHTLVPPAVADEQSTYLEIARGIALDVSLYNAALAVCVCLSPSLHEARLIIEAIRRYSLTLTDMTYHILAKLHIRLQDEALRLLLSAEECQRLDEAVAARAERNQTGQQQLHQQQQAPKTSYAGLLGPDASEVLRQSVIRHDLQRLVDRADPALGGDCAQVSENDFATLIHQARKRKWGAQVGVVLALLEELSTRGCPDRGIPPIAHLAPGGVTFEACFTAYVGMGMRQEAVALYAHMKSASPRVLDETQLVFALVKGFVQSGLMQWAADCYALKRKMCLQQPKLLQGLLRGMGRNVSDGVNIVCDIARAHPESAALLRECWLLLLESVAIIGSHLDLEQLILDQNSLSEPVRLSPDSGPSASYVRVCLMACVSCGDRVTALHRAAHWQQLGALLPAHSPVLLSLVDEAFLACPSAGQQAREAAQLSTLPFRGFALPGALRTLDALSPLIEFLTSASHLLLFDSSVTNAAVPEYDMSAEVSFEREPMLPYYLSLFSAIHLRGEVSRESSTYVGVLLLQRLYTRWLTVKSKKASDGFMALLGRCLEPHCDDVLYAVFGALLAGASRPGLLCAPPKVLVRLVRLFGEALPSRDARVSDVCARLRDIKPSLDVTKEVARLFGLCDREDGLQAIVACVECSLLSGEAPSKVMQFVSPISDIVLLFDRLPDIIDRLAAAMCASISEFHAGVLFVGCFRDDGRRNAVGILLAQALLQRGEQELCARFAIQCELSTEDCAPDIQGVVCATLTAGRGASCPASRHPEDPTADFLPLPGQVRTLIVDSAPAVRYMQSQVLHSETVAVDVEWRPSHLYAPRLNKCALLQLATREEVFLVDLLVLERGKASDESSFQLYRDFIRTWSSSGMLKLGFGIAFDWSRLCESYPDTFVVCFSDVPNVVDLREHSAAAGLSMSRLCAQELGLPLSKAMQTSDWETRPLSQEQVMYAALDAYVLIPIWEHICVT